jgi:hypothetical protein
MHTEMSSLSSVNIYGVLDLVMFATDQVSTAVLCCNVAHEFWDTVL